jgi:periplasmic divalent cation tolerance protein
MTTNSTEATGDRVVDTTRAVVVMTTWPVDREASTLARTLVTERLAACVSVLQEIESTYTWKDKLCSDRERQIIMKSTRDRVPALHQRLRELHPYEVPEFLVLPVSSGSAGYLEWLEGDRREPS